MLQPLGFKWESDLFSVEHHLRTGAFNMPSNHYHDAYEIYYLNEHYQEDLNLKTIQERFFISPYHFSRTFKKITGFNFIEYLNSIRTREAQKLLKDSGLPVTEISEHVGFDNLTHFGRVFKKIVGTSPTNYRKNN
ncbi:MAG: helix-turn-helix transcriptional regulator [Bacteroidota bacterium]